MGEDDNGPRSRQSVLSDQKPQSVPAVVPRVISPESAGSSDTSATDVFPRSTAELAERPPSRPTEPSWTAVIATTVRLWVRRHGPAKPGRRRRWRIVGLIVLALAVFVGGALAAIAFRHPAKPAPVSGAAAAAAALAGQETATLRYEAAAWVSSQVSGNAIVACDPAMCPVLQAQGVLTSNLLVLRPTAPDPLGSDVVVATAAVRAGLGSRLASVYAPEVIASFSSGAQRIDIRAVAPDGAAAYLVALRADLRARRAAGAQLLRNPRLTVTRTARKDLAAGKVDSRLLITLAALVNLHPLRVTAFGDPGPGAATGVPLRSVDVSAANGATGDRGAAELGFVRAFVVAQRPPYVPTSVTVVGLAGDRTALRIEFGAPSQLGLLGTRTTP
jgi:hypothetical protein